VTDRLSLSGLHPAGLRHELARAECLRAQVRYAVDAGIDVVQVRERDLEARDLMALVVTLLAISRGTRTRLVVNDRLDVAMAAGADGVHLRGDSIPPSTVRTIAPRGFIVGRSVHGVEEAAALGAEVDYLIAGSVWPTTSKPAARAPIGLDGLAAIVRATRIPVVAIGGVRAELAPQVARAGASGVAGIGLFMSMLDRTGPNQCRAESLKDRASAIRRAFGIP
jgi:thiamine-phosphate diphosphorylase